MLGLSMDQCLGSGVLPESVRRDQVSLVDIGRELREKKHEINRTKT